MLDKKKGDTPAISSICRICEDLFTAKSLPETLQVLARGTASALGANACIIRILDERRTVLLLGASHGLSKKYLEKGPIEIEKSPSDRKVLEGERTFISDISRPPRPRYWKDMKREGIRSILSLQIAAKDRPVGIMRIYSSKPHGFTEGNMRVAATLACQGGIAIEKAQLMEEMKVLISLSRSVSSSLNLPEVLRSIVRNAAAALKFKGASIRLLNQAGNILELKATFGLSSTYLEKGPIELKKSRIDQEVFKGKPAVISDVSADRRLQYPRKARKEGIGAMLSLPLAIKKKVIGVLRVYSSVPYDFNPSEINFLSALASQGAIAIENARLFEHLKRDHEDLSKEVWKWYDWGEKAPRL